MGRFGRTLAVFAVAALASFAVMLVAADLSRTAGDGNYYTMMADGGWLTTPSPFSNRILSPMIAALLPLPAQWAFAVVAAVWTGVAFAALDRLLGSMFPSRTVWLGLALLATCGPLRQVLEVPAYIDAGTLATSCVVFVGLRERRWLLVVVALAFGVANHEMALLLVVPIGLTAWRERKLADGMLAAVVAGAAWWFLHRSGLVIDINNAPNLTDPVWRAEVVGVNVDQYHSVAGAVWWHAMTGWGVALILAPLGWRRAPQLARDGVWILPLCAVACLGATNWGRMFTPAAPVLIVLACAAVSGEVDGAVDVDAANTLPGDRDVPVA